jgi:hyperosmotically inducible periplasmic protein
MLRTSFAAPLLLALAACGAEQDRTPFRDDRPVEEAKRDAEAVGENIKDGAGDAGDAIKNGAENVVAEIDDVALTTSVKAALVSADDLKAADITVRSENGIVSLSGTVPSLEQKVRATSVAVDVKGVQRVKNELEVKG